MDNIGYQNWSSQDINDQSMSSSDAGSPTHYSLQTSSVRGRPKGRQRDDYSFEYSQDSNSDFNNNSIGKKPSVYGSSGLTSSSTGKKSERALYHEMGPSVDKKPIPTRRMSTDDRMKEILSKNRESLTTMDVDPSTKPFSSVESQGGSTEDLWIATRASILEGLLEKDTTNNTNTKDSDMMQHSQASSVLYTHFIIYNLSYENLPIIK